MIANKNQDEPNIEMKVIETEDDLMLALQQIDEQPEFMTMITSQKPKKQSNITKSSSKNTKEDQLTKLPSPDKVMAHDDLLILKTKKESTAKKKNSK